MYYKVIYNSPIGKIILKSDGEYLIGLDFEREFKVDKNTFIGKDNAIDVKAYDELQTDRAAKEIESVKFPVFTQTMDWLDIYFSGKNPNFELPIKFIKGTSFQLEVWNILNQIPYGDLITYGDIAREIAKKRGIEKMSAQAVGGAVGSNPIGIIVPCHRVIGANGNITGYAGGIDKKLKLLEIEHIDISKIRMPKVKNPK